MNKKIRIKKKITIMLMIVLLLIIISLIAIRNLTKKNKVPSNLGLSETADYNKYLELQNNDKKLEYKNAMNLDCILNDDLKLTDVTTDLKNIIINEIPKIKKDIEDMSAINIEQYAKKYEIKTKKMFISNEQIYLLINKVSEMHFESDAYEFVDFEKFADNAILATCNYKDGFKLIFCIYRDKNDNLNISIK